MKIRKGFVSNSSSSSFVCFGVELYYDDGYETHKAFYDKLGLTKDKIETSQEYEFVNNIVENCPGSDPNSLALCGSGRIIVGVGLRCTGGCMSIKKPTMKEIPGWEERFNAAYPELAGKGIFMFGEISTE